MAENEKEDLRARAAPDSLVGHDEWIQVERLIENYPRWGEKTIKISGGMAYAKYFTR